MSIFALSAESIHILNGFSSNMKLPTCIREKMYYYSFEQLAFLSPKVFLHYLESSQTFQVELTSRNIDEFLKCFDQFDGLFRTSNSIQVNSSNVQFFIQIAEKLDNSFLMETCISLSGNEARKFSLSSLHFKWLSFQAKNSLKNFIFVVNGQQVKVNRLFFTCVSSLLLKLDLSVDYFSINVSEDVFRCFLSFIKIFEGIPFHWGNFNSNTIFSMINLFKIQSLKRDLF
jgi:hypothetical protein